MIIEISKLWQHGTLLCTWRKYNNTKSSMRCLTAGRFSTAGRDNIRCAKKLFIWNFQESKLGQIRIMCICAQVNTYIFMYIYFTHTYVYIHIHIFVNTPYQHGIWYTLQWYGNPTGSNISRRHGDWTIRDDSCMTYETIYDTGLMYTSIAMVWMQQQFTTFATLLEICVICSVCHCIVSLWCIIVG